MYNFWCLINLLITKFLESEKILKMYFKTILDLCCVKFLEPLDEHRPGSKSETRSKIQKKMKSEIFEKLKFSSLNQNFKLKYTKKTIKVKNFSAAARLAAAAHASACEKVLKKIIIKKKILRVKNSKIQFFGCFYNF